VDWRAEVLINGQAVGQHEGGYAPFSFDVSGALKREGPQEVVVQVWDPTDFGTQPRGKQVVNPSGIFYTSVSGIWQTVWLEPVGSSCITGIKAVSDIPKKTVTFTIQAEGGKSDKVTIQCQDLGAKVSGRIGEPMAMSVPSAKLWSPDVPTLYPITVKLSSGDTVQSYFAMRKTSVGKDKDGIMRMMLNDEFIFQHGPLDQGWWPDGLYTAPTDAALQYDLAMVKSMGFNMLRKHVKVEPARFYYHCDRMGVLVWQDMPSMSVGGEGCGRPGASPFSEAAKANYEREWKEIIETFQFFPCIVMWVPFNEGWCQYDTERIAAWTKELDPTRLVNNASGWVDKHYGDIVDMHN
jgi:beta-galactosidase/beta-glucuronidase